MRLPPGSLARFVSEASGNRVLAVGAILLGVTGAAVGVTLWRLRRLYRDMQGAWRPVKSRPMPADRVGGLATWLDRFWTRRPEERAGYWLGKTMLAHDPELAIRCLLPMNMAVAVVIVGVAAGQFADPLLTHEMPLVVLPVLSVYLIGLAVPPILYNLSFSRNYAAAWMILTAPMDRPADLALGMCKAIVFRVAVPLCGIWACVAALVWRDPTAVLLHFALAALLSWLLGLVGLVLVVREPPLSLSGGDGRLDRATCPSPMAALSSAMILIVAVHCRFAASPLFWLIAVGGSLAAERPLRRLATARLCRLMEAHMTRLMSLLNRNSIRWIQGQLVLLGLTYAGAVGLAVTALCFRSYFSSTTLAGAIPRLRRGFAG